MRILHLLASPVWSGPAEGIALLAQAQRELGHQVTFAVDRKRLQVSSEELAAPRLRSLGLLDECGLELSVKSMPWKLLQDATRLRGNPADVVHAHFSHDHLLARIALAGRPTVLVRSIHADRSLRPTLPRAHGYTVASAAQLQQLGRAPAILLPPLVDPLFRPPESLQQTRHRFDLRGSPVIGMASTFQASRRHLVGLEAFAGLRQRSPNAHLVLLGDGILEATLRRRTAELGLEKAVTFAGYQAGTAFVEWMQVLDQLWILGLGNDASGRVAAQGRACGVRIVAVNEGALAEQADSLLKKPTAAELIAASLSNERRASARPDNLQIARKVCDLYQEALVARQQR